MKFGRMLAMLLVLSLILSVGAYATGADEAGEGTDAVTADGEEKAAGEKAAGPTDLQALADEDETDAQQGCIVLDRHTAKVLLEGGTVAGEGGVLIRSVCGGDEAVGGVLEIVLRDADAAGDIIHGDGHSDMTVALDGAHLTGAVNGTDGTDETDERQDPGILMTVDGASCWTVTGESRLDSILVEKGAIIQAPEGQDLAVYVNCTPDEAGRFDASTGTYIADFVAGVEYANAVILVTDEADGTDAEPDLFAALGIDTAVVDGGYGVALEAFLEAMGVEMTYDEQTGAIIIEDPNGVLDILTDRTEE